MAEQEELEIEIGADGKVQVHVKGRKGKKCLDYVQVFRNLLSGRVEDQKLTSEYYETGTREQVEQHLRRG